MIDAGFVEMAQQLGTSTLVLGCAFWYIRFLNQTFDRKEQEHQLEREKLRLEAAEERKRFDEKDTAADIRILELQKSSYQSLMSIMENTTKVLQDLHTSINELKIIMQQETKSNK